jgi:glycyl-tRNA synthetase
MAFIVKKKIHGKEYFYLNENKRVDGKVKTKTIAYLGKDKAKAIKKSKEILNSMSKGEEKVKKEKYILEKVHYSVEEMANFCKSKGFVYRSSDIYGGFSGFWDFGPLGVELFGNISKSWWNYFVRNREDVVGIKASVISHPKTWVASGHVENFNDLFVRCKKCKKTDKIDETELGKVKCKSCGGEFESMGKFNLMFKTSVGAQDSEEVYLRGETAQGIFMDFKLVSQTSRMNLPFGIAQIGRCFRNEIAPRDFLFRSREFHIGEFEYFINPDIQKCNKITSKQKKVKLKFLDSETQNKGKDDLIDTTIGDMIKNKIVSEWQGYFLAEQILFFHSIGLKNLKVREHTKVEEE